MSISLYCTRKLLSEKFFLRLLWSKPNNIMAMSTETKEYTCIYDKCLFCNIIKENDETNKILFQDEKVAVFSDIKPASKHHYLIVTKNHIKDAKQLTKGDRSLVEHMVSVGKKMLEGQNSDNTNTRFGFHWPPFHSVAHLHLHVIFPTQEMGFISRMIFRPDSWWFVSPEYVLSRLEVE